ncbi:MAG: DUF3365 domain-containing protein [Bacteroidia bacterium]|nr:DUF3365 domain-containing protein [Bacteroidia bacterium]MDW8236668.1 DUF3365 domain-containing protein [Bacteroidia bacterium]
MRTVGIMGIFLMVACQPTGNPSSSSVPSAPNVSQPEPSEVWRVALDSLTTEKQRSILQKVLHTAEKQGWAGAVSYCHAAAETLTFFRNEKIHLQRVALRNRNPKNALQDSLDHAAYQHFEQSKRKESLVWQANDGKLRYYRPIYIIMPQCLKCHGNQKEIDGPALAMIRKLYPGDKAQGFAEGDLRGLWKAEIQP